MVCRIDHQFLRYRLLLIIPESLLVLFAFIITITITIAIAVAITWARLVDIVKDNADVLQLPCCKKVICCPEQIFRRVVLSNKK